MGGSQNYDLLILGGTVVDGTGAAPFRADVGIRGDTIVDVGHLRRLGAGGDLGAERVIDAEGLHVAPGFIDIHAHSDLAPFSDPLLTPKLLQGVTTEVVGNCGLSAAPVPRREREEWLGRFAGVWGLPGSLPAWQSFEGYLESLEAAAPAVNIAALVGHGALRLSVLGMEARAAAPSEIGDLCKRLRETFSAGAFGLSMGLLYPPACYAEKKEVLELWKTVAAAGGFVSVHMRSEGDGVMESLQECGRLSDLSAASLHVAHLKAYGRANWTKTGALLRAVEESGTTFDQYPYTVGSTTLNAALPPWIQEGGVESMLSRLRDADLRRRLADEIRNGLEGWENYIGSDGFGVIEIASVTKPRNRVFQGMRLDAVADRMGVSPVEALCDLILSERGTASMLIHGMNEDSVRSILSHRSGMVGSDGLYGSRPHPRLWGTFPRVLARYVRKERVLPLPDAVRKMTFAPARRLGMKDRGRIARGVKADLVLFDPVGIRDRATFAKPDRPPEGIHCSVVNGAVAVDNGRPTGVRAGRVLRGRFQGAK